MPIETLTVEEIARSAYNACAHAAMVEDGPNWEGEGTDQQARWIYLARRAQEELPSFDGKKAPEAARWLYEQWARDAGALDWEHLALRLRLCWEAVARHLATLLDSDELEDMAALEHSWGEWTAARTSRG
jgi:hypothetical protein